MTLKENSVGNKNSGRPYRTHLNTKADLITSSIETRSGFLELALEKNRQATPFITQARALKAAVLTHIPHFRFYDKHLDLFITHSRERYVDKRLS